MDTIWDQIQSQSDYSTRQQEVAAFNNSNRWVKKGIFLMPCKYGMEWAPSGFGAQINVYADGTIQLSHSGCEIGQGINTKAMQVLALELGVDMSLIRVTSTNSQHIPNGSTTGGSVTSELCSQAVIGAARKLNEKLAPLKRLNPGQTWFQLVATATRAQMILESRSSHVSVNQTGQPFQYSAYGAAIAQTRVDILTGEVQVERVDILYDCGISLNPAIDIGQVEGGFVQGMGLYLSEKLIYDANGRLTTNGTWEYKPPSSKDIPIDFRVSLLSDAPNPLGILSSKASGEPPMTLSASVFFAVRQAISVARKAAGLSDPPILLAPATPDAVGVASGLSLTQLTIQ
jgi:xanthine dehydrogenase/oxidase